jgi:hypothetical protein
MLHLWELCDFWEGDIGQYNILLWLILPSIYVQSLRRIMSSCSLGLCGVFVVGYVSQPWPWARNQIEGLKRCGPKGKYGSHISCFWECRRVWGNKHSHYQVNSHFGSWTFDGLPMDSRIFIERLHGSKPIKLNKSLYHWEALRT